MLHIYRMFSHTRVTFEYLMSSQYRSAESEILSTDIHGELGEFTWTTRRQLMAGFCVHTPGQMASLEGKLSFAIIENSEYAIFFVMKNPFPFHTDPF